MTIRPLSLSAPMDALLVDDDPSVTAWISRLLREDGWQVHTAETVREALDMIGNRQIQVAIVDFELPDGCGTEAVQSLRQAVADAAILMISGHTDDDSVVNGLMAGADDFMHKPISATVLRSRPYCVGTPFRIDWSLETCSWIVNPVASPGFWAKYSSPARNFNCLPR